MLNSTDSKTFGASESGMYVAIRKKPSIIRSLPKACAKMDSETNDQQLEESQIAASPNNISSARGSSDSSEVLATETKPSRSLSWKVEFCLLLVMLGTALAGMAITQASVNDAWEYWVFAVLVFGSIGIIRDLKYARQAHLSVWKAVAKQVIHWSVLLVVMKALFWMEQYSVVTREASSLAALLLLSLTCIQAGIHLHWTFAIVGVVLAIMAVVLGVLEQSTLLAWMIMLPIVIAGAAFFFLRARKLAAG